MQSRSRWIRRCAVSAAVMAGVLVFAGIAWADKEKIQLQLKSDAQAAARATLLKRADLGTVLDRQDEQAGLLLGDAVLELPPEAVRPRSTTAPPRLAGAIRPPSRSHHRPRFWRRPTMVALDWQRTVQDSRVLQCLHTELAKGLPAETKLAPFKRIAFPRLSPHSAAFRALVDVKAPTATVRMMFDFVLVGHGRTEISLTVTAPAAAAAAVRGLELRLAQLMISRAKLNAGNSPGGHSAGVPAP